MNQFQSLAEVLAALRRRAWLILLITALGCVASLYFALNMVKVYEATAVVQIEEAQVPDALAGATAQADNAARRVQLIEQRLMARDNLIRIMDKHDLFTGDPDMSVGERIFRMREAARIEEIRMDAGGFMPGATPSGLLITTRLDDPQKAADLANELMYSVIEQSRSRAASSARETAAFFDAESARVGAQIASLEERIAAFKRENIEALPAGISALRDELTSLREADLGLDQQILTLRTDSTRQREDVRDRQIALLLERKALIGDRIAEIEIAIRRAPDVERTLGSLERELTQLQDQYSVITRRTAEAEMTLMLEDRQQMDRFEVLETALVPENPVSRSRKKMALAGGVASVIAGLALAFVLELLNPALRSAAQMERVLGVQPVVSIPPIRTRHDRRWTGLKGLAILAAVLAALWAGLRIAGQKVPWQALLDRVLPRALQGG